MKRSDRWVVLVACAVVAWFYIWTVQSNGDPWKFGKEQKDYYNLLIDGYLAGQLNMKVEVPPALMQLKDPYDPGERPVGLGLHDASFYHGKYYVYFGAAPMVVLMLPFRVLTGVDLPLSVAILAFTYGGFLASVATWLAIRRRYFPETSLVVVATGVLVLGLTGVGAVLLRRPAMWELPIAGGYGFAMLALFCVWQSLHSVRRRAGWFAGAGLCFGLAIASRPTYLVASPFLAAPLVWWWRSERRLPWRMAWSAVVPLMLVGAAMAGHNYARFGDPLQFGQKYQFSLDYESKLPHFRAAYVPFTAKAHFVSVAEWTRYYPFFHRAELGQAPEGFTIHRGDVYGILTSFPITCLAFLAPLALWRRSREERGRLAAWLAGAALLFGTSAVLLLLFFSALARYQMDFVPAFILLAGVGLLAVERWLGVVASAGARRIARAVWLGTAVFSIGFGMLFSLGFDGLLKERNPAMERTVARLLNRLPALIERMTGVQHGPLELTIRLPEEKRSGRETLFTIGAADRFDRVFVSYIGDQRVQFGVLGYDGAEQVSRPLTLDPHAPHRVAVSLGSLFPPRTHPWFAGKSREEARRARTLVSIEVDGEPVLIAPHRSPDDAGKLGVGDQATVIAAYPRFRGSILSVQRHQEPISGASPRGNFVRLRLAFSPASSSACEPLLAFGPADAGRLLAVTRAAPDRIQLLLTGPGAPNARSDVITCQPGKAHELVAHVELSASSRPPRLIMWLDGQLVWAPELRGGLRFPAPVAVGQNILGVGECAAAFTGEIFSVQQDATGRDPLSGAGDTLRVKLKFPSQQAGGREPVVVTGRSGAGDLLTVERLDAQTVQFALDHWGTPLQTSTPVRVDFAQTHTLELTLPSLREVANPDANREMCFGQVRLKLDGAIVWEPSGEFFGVEPEEIAIGRNPIGGTSCGPAFSGDILSAERVAHE